MGRRRVRSGSEPLSASLVATPSKSVTHRALVAAALATSPSSIHDPLVSADTCITRDALAALGVVTREVNDVWHVEGRGGELRGGADLWLGESGTSFRLLLAVAALGERPSRLDGVARLRERPIEELARALVSIGAVVESTNGGAELPTGLPMTAGGRRPVGGTVRLAAGRSSQFASALLMIGPRLEEGIDLVLEPPIVSLPYVELTERMLRTFGVSITRPGPLRWRVEPADYAGRELRVEGDHSSASYFLAAAAVRGGRVRVQGLDPQSVQPDARLGELLEQMGCRRTTGDDWIEIEGTGSVSAFDVDLSDAPDLGPTVAVLGLFADGPSVLRGVAHLRHKESDRLALLAENLTALGRPAHAEDDRLVIGERPARFREATIRTAGDHRMAMAFALAGLAVDGVTVDDADCVAKSNPEFWKAFERLEGCS